LRQGLTLLNPLPFFNMPNRATLLTALLAALLAATLAAAASVELHSRNPLVGNATVVQFGEGKRPVYFVLWWPPDDAKNATLVAYMPGSSLHVPLVEDVSVLLLDNGIAARVAEEKYTFFAASGFVEIKAEPVVKPGARCAYAANPASVMPADVLFFPTYQGYVGYYVWCLVGNATLRAHRANLTLPLWAYMGGISATYYMGSFPVELPEEGYVVRWPAAFPMMVYADLYGRSYNEAHTWEVKLAKEVSLPAGSYLVVGVWPNGTVRQWRFAARSVAATPRSLPFFAEGAPAVLREMGLDKLLENSELRPMPWLWADAPICNYNDYVGDRGNGTAVATYASLSMLQGTWPEQRIRLLPNGTAVYVVGPVKVPHPDTIVPLVMLWAKEKYGRSYSSAGFLRSFEQYIPKYDYRDGWDFGGFDVVNEGGRNYTVLDVVSVRLFYHNWTLVVKHFVVRNDTGCLGVYAVKYVPKPGAVAYAGYRTHEVNCTLDKFQVDEVRVNLTYFRLSIIGPKCKLPDWLTLVPLDPNIPTQWWTLWLFVMRAPTAFSPLLSYRGDEVASVRISGDYAVVTFAKASKEYNAVRLAAQIVKLLTP